ncbi:Nudix-like NDP and NTP phosphohydrolase NudJ [hydrothermal vent metagenome]|uniref:Phosphatase NudJ n=1 Tax=hydrothermal vent metagenome TaxID=652676 RepID=A0A3B0ZWB1_9ZZZZ
MNQLPNNWIPHVTVAAIVQHNEQFLMVEEKINAQRVINQPAGHWERSESLIEAVKRETLEETACIVEAEYLIGIYNWTIPENENAATTTDTFLRFTFKCRFLEDTNAELDPDIHRRMWLSEQQIRSTDYQKRSPLVLRSLNDCIKGKNYPLDLFIDIK